MNDYLSHYGVIGMKWGVRKQVRAARKLSKRDDRWVKKKADKIEKQARKATQKEMQEFAKNELKTVLKTNGKLSSATIMQYNTKLAKVLNSQIGNIPAPSGRVLRFVAKRDKLGVHQALADVGYDMTKVKNGVYSGGKVAYRKENLMQEGGH